MKLRFVSFEVEHFLHAQSFSKAKPVRGSGKGSTGPGLIHTQAERHCALTLVDHGQRWSNLCYWIRQDLF